MIFLAADIGGSNSRLLLGEAAGAAWRMLRQETLASAQFAGIDALLEHFLRPDEKPVAACLALAGPVAGPVARLTNLPWRIDAADLGRRRGFRLWLLNDFVAQAHGLPGLAADSVLTLQAGEPLAGAPRVLLGAGTGLGMAVVVGQGDDAVVLPSEAGHADFAPADAEQADLLRYLMPHHGRVSLETVLSGPGLERLYGYLAGLPAEARPPLDAAAISAAGSAGEAVAAASLRLFARIYASAAGNLALTCLPQGGVYIGGGIAPKILPFLTVPEVLVAFNSKPPMVELLRQMPLHLVREDLLGLHGAARVAARMAREAE
jgi:glucokinase